jgi:glycosyltransferase involved in cell wall biosynthesis
MAAAGRLSAAGENAVQFVLSGKGDQESELAGAAARLRNVVLTGWLSAEQLSAVAAVAGIGVAAYSKGAPQGLPNKIFEYLSAGLPILCSLPTEARELIEHYDCGSYYEAGNAEALAEGTLRLAKDENLRSEMARNALAVFVHRFSADSVYNDFADYLEQYRS